MDTLTEMFGSITLTNSDNSVATQTAWEDEKPKKPVRIASKFQGGCSSLSLWRFNEQLMVRKQPDNEIQYLCETEALKILRGHPHIVNMVSYKRGILCLEYCEQGDLFDLIQANGHLGEKRCKTIVSQLCSALIAAKQKNIFHRDLKLENVFFDNCGNVKLGDWGLCSFRTHSKRIKGTLGSIAPEQLTGNGAYDLEKADVWSLGVLLFMMVFGRLPYEIPSKRKKKTRDGQHLEFGPLLRMILRSEWKKFWLCHHSPAGDFHTVKGLLESMLSADPKDRPTFEEIASHRWLKEISRGAVTSPTSVVEHIEPTQPESKTFIAY